MLTETNKQKDQPTMWITSLDGFISVNASMNKPDHRHLKARRLEHLESAFPDFVDDVDDKYETNEQHDYRFHLDVPTEVVVEWLTRATEAIDYTGNTKGNIGERWPELSEAAFAVWAAMYEVQETAANW
jgi:hypothetical protein